MGQLQVCLSEKNNSPIVAASRSAIVVATLFGTFMILGCLLKYSFYGLDFTDESFYLIWISNPFIYPVSITQFGFVYHPLYVVLSGNIVAIRWANILITFGLGWLLVYNFLMHIALDVTAKRIYLHAGAAGLATSCFAMFNTWLPTPNYNSLAFQALLLTSIGLLWSGRTATLKSLVGWVVIGVGGWLAFMAKPSTAAILAVCVPLCLWASSKFSFRLSFLALATALGLLLVSALLIDGSIVVFVRRLLLGIEASELLGGGYTASQILRIDRIRLHTPEKLAILFVLILSLSATYGFLSRRPKDVIFFLVPSIIFFVVTALMILGAIHKTTGFGELEGLLSIGVALSAFFSGLIFSRVSPMKTIPASHLAIAGLFLMMPYMYAFGTNRNYWENGAWAGIFWLLAGLTVIGPVVRERSSWSVLLPLALATQATTAILVHTGLELPQRQNQALRLNDAAVKIGSQQSTLILSRGYASYITEAETTAADSGFIAGTPMIDLSGQSPGILYALGAESIGQAWTIGGYPGSLKLAEASLDRVPCEKIAKAWVLFEPDGPSSIPTEVMSSLGSAFPEGYAKAGSWRTAKGAGGYAASRIQELYQAKNPAQTLKLCQSLREGKRS